MTDSASPESLRALSDAATEGEWDAVVNATLSNCIGVARPSGRYIYLNDRKNREFAVAAVNYVRAALQRADAAPEGLRAAIGELLDDYLDRNGPDGYPQPMPEAWRVVQDWYNAAAAPSEPPALDVRLERADWIIRLTENYMARYGQANTSGERHADRKMRAEDIRAEIAAYRRLATPAPEEAPE